MTGLASTVTFQEPVESRQASTMRKTAILRTTAQVAGKDGYGHGVSLITTLIRVTLTAPTLGKICISRKDGSAIWVNPRNRGHI